MDDFLQSIKLKIGRKSELSLQERTVFHKILGILKTNAAFEVLKKELESNPIIRESAVSVLYSFPQAYKELKTYLLKDITDSEKIMILENIQNNGNAQDIPLLMEFIDTINIESPSKGVTASAFSVLCKLGADNIEALNYLNTKIDDEKNHEFIRSHAILALSHFTDVKKFEDILKDANETFSMSAYTAISAMNLRILERYAKNKDDFFTFSETINPDDDPLIRIRMLLSKMAVHFNDYSTPLKIAYICAMISCNHREYNLYIMKALSSRDHEFITGTLYGILKNIDYINDPDKTFKNLIHVIVESHKDNDIIIDIFVKFFTIIKDTRKYNILRDSIYGYITIAFQDDFNTYRKNYLFKDMVEEGYSEHLRLFRKFILEKTDPELKKEIIEFLQNDLPSDDETFIDTLGKKIKFILNDEIPQIASLVEILFEPHEASRKKSANAIADIDYNRHYLKMKIIRLCRIIGKLKINGAASQIVNSYNYLKKYPDIELSLVMEETLAELNYSYFLGEIELLLFTGAPKEQEKGLVFISYFNNQSSINILFEYLKTNALNPSPLVGTAIKILMDYDLWNNISANEIFKTIIESNANEEIKTLAILGLGHCGFETEIAYLDNLFFSAKEQKRKDIIVRAISRIARLSDEVRPVHLRKYFQEYLKDQGINVRIYANICLFMLGDENAAKSLREMLVIKNKSVQRKIISIIAILRSLEFSFFMISLLTPEYEISLDIIDALKLLPEKDMHEINFFIINILKKYETPPPNDAPEIKTLRTEKIVLLQTDIDSDELNYKYALNTTSLSDAIDMNLRTTSFVLQAIEKYNGNLTLFSESRVIAFFKDQMSAVRTATEISGNINASNRLRKKNSYTTFVTQIITAPSSFFPQELLFYPKYMIDSITEKSIQNKIIVDQKTREEISEYFLTELIPNMLLPRPLPLFQYFTIKNPVNFKIIALDSLQNFQRETEQRKFEEELKVTLESKYLASEAFKGTTVEKLENIVNKLKIGLDNIDNYVASNSSNAQLNENVHRMLSNIYENFKVEISRLIVK